MRNWLHVFGATVFLANVAAPAVSLTVAEAVAVGDGLALGACSTFAAVSEHQQLDIRMASANILFNGIAQLQLQAVSSGTPMTPSQVIVPTAAQYLSVLTNEATCNLPDLTLDDIVVVPPTVDFDTTEAFGFAVRISGAWITVSFGDISVAVDSAGGDAGGGVASGLVGPEIAINADTTRRLVSNISSNQRLVREGRTRFIQSRRQMRGDSAGISSRNSVDFEFDGTLNATNGYISSQGSFFQQDGNFEGTSRRVLFGDFDIQRSSDTGSTTATLTGKMAWERMLDEQNMIGYYVGADVARSNIKGTYTGEQDTYGISVGTYFVSALQENLFLDGFVSLGVGKNDLTLADGTVDLKGDFNSRSVTLGTALTGVIKQEGYEIWPELAFTYGKTRLGTIGMTDRLAAVANNSVTVDAGDVSIANLTLRPEYRLPMDGLASVDSLSLFTFAPRLLCEQVETTAKSKNCGGGAEFGIDRTSEDGRSRFVARIKADRIAKVTRSALELKFEHRF